MPSADSGEALGNGGTVQNWRATEVGKYIICQFQVTRDWRVDQLSCQSSSAMRSRQYKGYRTSGTTKASAKAR
jgi:hypothetical protein